MSRRIVYVKVPIVIDYHGVKLKEHVNEMFDDDVFVGEEYVSSVDNNSIKKAIYKQFQMINKIVGFNK